MESNNLVAYCAAMSHLHSDIVGVTQRLYSYWARSWSQMAAFADLTLPESLGVERTTKSGNRVRGLTGKSQDLLVEMLRDPQLTATPCPDGSRPQPIVMVARELSSGRLVRLTAHELATRSEPPYSIDPDALFVAYYASAELGATSRWAGPYPPSSSISTPSSGMGDVLGCAIVKRPARQPEVGPGGKSPARDGLRPAVHVGLTVAL